MVAIAPNDATRQAFLQTSFFNWSITGAYRVGADILAGTQTPLTLGPHGTLLADGKPLHADYAVTALPLVGRTVTSDGDGRLHLIRLRNGVARVGTSTRQRRT